MTKRKRNVDLKLYCGIGRVKLIKERFRKHTAFQVCVNKLLHLLDWLISRDPSVPNIFPSSSPVLHFSLKAVCLSMHKVLGMAVSKKCLYLQITEMAHSLPRRLTLPGKSLSRCQLMWRWLICVVICDYWVLLYCIINKLHSN